MTAEVRNKFLSYSSSVAVTIAHCIVNEYKTWTKHQLTDQESEFVGYLLEERNGENEGDINEKVPSIHFRQLWQGQINEVMNLGCGRFLLTPRGDNGQLTKKNYEYKSLQQ